MLPSGEAFLYAPFSISYEDPAEELSEVASVVSFADDSEVSSSDACVASVLSSFYAIRPSM
jgi:hypothetical protein